MTIERQNIRRSHQRLSIQHTYALWMTFPAHGTSYRVSLTIHKHTHASRLGSRKTRKQELWFARKYRDGRIDVSRRFRRRL